VGIDLSAGWYMPERDNERDINASARALVADFAYLEGRFQVNVLIICDLKLE